MKRCTLCGEMLPLSSFSAKDKRGRLHARCIECLRIVAREAARKRRATPEGKEAVNRYRREWYARNGSKRQASVVARDRAIRVLIDRHRDEYDAVYREHAAALGVAVGSRRKVESQPCSSPAADLESGTENECCPAVGTDRAAFPNPVEGSEMDERRHAADGRVN